MPHRLTPTPLPDSLEPLARDVLRGLRRAMSRPKRLFEPVGSLLPQSLRSYVDDLTVRIDASRDLRRPSRPAARGLDGLPAATPSLFAAGSDASLDFASLCYRGLRIVLERLGRNDLIVSETVAGYAFLSSVRDRDPLTREAETAAAVALKLLQHHAIGYAPGTGIGLGEADRTDSRIAIFVVVLWLLLERPGAETDEAQLLDLAFGLVAVERARVVEAADRPDAIADLLETFSGLI